jgi:hypothetical protein
MLGRYGSESRNRYVSTSERNRFTPRMRTDLQSGAHLTRPDGGSAAVEDANYVVVSDATQPGNKRLLVDFEKEP